MKGLIYLLLLAAALFALIGVIHHATTPEVGDTVVARWDTDLKNYDDLASSLAYKPVTCHVERGQTLTITHVSGTLLSLENLKEDCTGGAFLSDFKLIKQH